MTYRRSFSYHVCPIPPKTRYEGNEFEADGLPPYQEFVSSTRSESHKVQDNKGKIATGLRSSFNSKGREKILVEGPRVQKVNDCKNRSRKSRSLPSSYSLNDIDTDDSEIDRVGGKLMHWTPEDYATQLTHIDLAFFKRITPEELMRCCWNKQNKMESSPNIVAFTKQFNKMSFWVVEEILKHVSPKKRASVIGFFVKVSKKLYEFGDFHALFAIISALRCASIYRLNETWENVSRKDKNAFERLSRVFSEEDNWKKLRERVESLRLPCIPYLGIFLTDLVYVDNAHPDGGGMECEQRKFKMNNILRVISHLQQSQYENLPVLPIMQEYLHGIAYMEELQKFVEDEQYKMSLRLEPPPEGLERHESGNLADSLAFMTLKSKKERSKYGHRKSLSLGTNSLMDESSSEMERHLLDDSLLEETSRKKINFAKMTRFSAFKARDNSVRQTVVVFEGCLKKKVVLRQGCHSGMSSWHKYWVQVAADRTLTFYSPKCFKGNNRDNFKKHPCKLWQIENCVLSLDNDPNVFFFKDNHKAKVHKFRAGNEFLALRWYRMLYDVMAGGHEREDLDKNLISFE